jgi:hypothetical protein
MSIGLFVSFPHEEAETGPAGISARRADPLED